MQCKLENVRGNYKTFVAFCTDNYTFKMYRYRLEINSRMNVKGTSCLL